MKRFWPLLSLITLILAFPIIAQEATETPTSGSDCPTIVQTALRLTRDGCIDTGINQACYGHIVLDASARMGIEDFTFGEPGDIVDLIQIESMRLSAMDEDTGQWGVVLMEVEPNSEEVAPIEDDVQILLFGDVELSDATQFVEVTANTLLNIRSQPTLDSPIITSLAEGESIVTNSRLEDGSWLRVRLSDQEQGLGWLFAEYITPNGDLESLNPISLEAALEGVEDERVRYGPMQAFYFSSGVNDAPCPEAPNSGILVQTPEGVASVSIWMDEVVIQLDATAFIQAAPNGDLTVSVLEGSAQVTAQGDTRTLIAGTSTSIALDEELAAVSAPTEPTAFDASVVQALPTELLDDPVDIPDPFENEPGTPYPGSWQFSWGVQNMVCDDGTSVPFESDGTPAIVQPQAEGLTISGQRYDRQSAGIYVASYVDGNGNLHQDTLQVIAGDRIQGEKTLDLISPICTLNVPFSLRLISSLN